MNSYKVFSLTDNKELYFKKLRDMCNYYNWNEQNIRNRKSISGLPMIKGNNQSGGFHIITKIEIK